MSDHFEPRRTLVRLTARVYKNRGVVIELAASYAELETQGLAAIDPLWAKYPKTQAFWQTLLDDAETRRMGKIDIHSVSALAIDEVRIDRGKDFPVEITVIMNNSAGIFQIEETLTRKVVHGPLARWITVTAVTRPADSPNDARIIERLTLRNGVFVIE